MNKFFIGFLLIILSSCNHSNEYENISDKFVSLYYQQMNQNQALQLSTMTAKDKIQDEIKLVNSRNNNFINDVPKISYKREDIKIKDDIALITYKLTIQPKNTSIFDKTVFISLHKENNSWKVSNFEELP